MQTEEEWAETAIVLTPPDTPDLVLIPGSVLLDTDCGHKGWAAPSTQDVLVQHPVLKILCVSCAVKVAQERSESFWRRP